MLLQIKITTSNLIEHKILDILQLGKITSISVFKFEKHKNDCNFGDFM